MVPFLPSGALGNHLNGLEVEPTLNCGFYYCAYPCLVLAIHFWAGFLGYSCSFLLYSKEFKASIYSMSHCILAIWLMM